MVDAIHGVLLLFGYVKIDYVNSRWWVTLATKPDYSLLTDNRLDWLL